MLGWSASLYWKPLFKSRHGSAATTLISLYTLWYCLSTDLSAAFCLHIVSQRLLHDTKCGIYTHVSCLWNSPFHFSEHHAWCFTCSSHYLLFFLILLFHFYWDAVVNGAVIIQQQHFNMHLKPFSCFLTLITNNYIQRSIFFFFHGPKWPLLLKF